MPEPIADGVVIDVIASSIAGYSARLIDVRDLKILKPGPTRFLRPTSRNNSTSSCPRRQSLPSSCIGCEHRERLHPTSFIRL